MFRKFAQAFTLAELLIALAILGEIAAFTIPKILSSQQNGTYKAVSKEAAATISAAYQLYKLDNVPSAGTKPPDLTSYINYVKIDSTATIDSITGSGSLTCGPCLQLHSGAKLYYTSEAFCGTSTTNAIYFYVDPDGAYGGTTNGPGKSVLLFLYYTGRITSGATMEANTRAGTAASCTQTYNGFADPTWFNWN